MLFPVLCNLLANYLELADLASCALLSRSLNAVWNAHLWRVVDVRSSRIRNNFLFPTNFERTGPLVRTLQLNHYRHSEAL